MNVFIRMQQELVDYASRRQIIDGFVFHSAGLGYGEHAARCWQAKQVLYFESRADRESTRTALHSLVPEKE